MPPKQKITRDEIIVSAYELALRDGFNNLSSRNVAHAAGCSVQPIFTHFPTMESLKQETYRYACQQCAKEVLENSSSDDLLTAITHCMIDLARNQPNLFKMLYLSDPGTCRSIPDSVMQTESHRRMTEIISQKRGLSLEDSEDILVKSCLLLMGIGTMICINKVDISEEVVLDIMVRTVSDLVDGIKSSV